MENTWYSVIAPESCSAILWKTWDYKEQAASELQLTAMDLKKMEIIEGVIPEPLGGAHRDWDMSANALKKQFLESLDRLSGKSPDELIENRIEKYATIGRWKVDPSLVDGEA